jgi:hypothetical protein
MSRSRVSSVSGWLRGRISLAAVLVVLAATLSGASTADSAAVAAPAPTCRDARVWPYNTSSIWNTPIGAAAAYAPAGLFPGPAAPKDGVFIDEDYFVETVWGDPTIDWYSQGHWNSTPDCEQFPWSPLVGRVPWPQNLTITIPGNNALALLQPDGDSLLFTQPAYRCTVDAPLLSIHDTWHMTGSLRYSDGNWGGHGVLLARVATCVPRTPTAAARRRGQRSQRDRWLVAPRRASADVGRPADAHAEAAAVGQVLLFWRRVRCVLRRMLVVHSCSVCVARLLFCTLLCGPAPIS